MDCNEGSPFLCDASSQPGGSSAQSSSAGGASSARSSSKSSVGGGSSSSAAGGGASSSKKSSAGSAGSVVGGGELYDPGCEIPARLANAYAYATDCPAVNWHASFTCPSDQCTAGEELCNARVSNDSVPEGSSKEDPCTNSFWFSIAQDGQVRKTSMSYADQSLTIHEPQSWTSDTIPPHPAPFYRDFPNEPIAWNGTLNAQHTASGVISFQRGWGNRSYIGFFCVYVKMEDGRSKWKNVGAQVTAPQGPIDPLKPSCGLNTYKLGLCQEGETSYTIGLHLKGATHATVHDAPSPQSCVNDIVAVEPSSCAKSEDGKAMDCDMSLENPMSYAYFTALRGECALSNQGTVIFDNITDGGDVPGGDRTFTTDTVNTPANCSINGSSSSGNGGGSGSSSSGNGDGIACPINNFCSVTLLADACRFNGCPDGQRRECFGTCSAQNAAAACYGTCCHCVSDGSSSGGSSVASSNGSQSSTKSGSSRSGSSSSGRSGGSTGSVRSGSSSNRSGSTGSRSSGASARSSSRASSAGLTTAPSCSGLECSLVGKALCASQNQACSQLGTYPCMACGGVLGTATGISSQEGGTIALGQSPLCGNGTVDPGESCDDGNTADGDACPAGCVYDGMDGLHGAPTVDAVSSSAVAAGGIPGVPQNLALCGNNRLDPGEQCDDGGRQSGDGCSANCWGEVLSNDGTTWVTASGNGNGQPGSQTDAQTQGYDVQSGLQAAVEPIIVGHAPAGKTGPATVLFMAVGAAGGLSWMRRKRR